MEENKIELTLSPDLTKDLDLSHITNNQDANKEMIDTSLSDSEMKMVDEFAKSIDVTNSQQVLEYGIGVQKKLSDFSDKTLETIRTRDLGEVGGLISNLVVELKGFDTSGEKKFLGIFKKAPKKAQILKANYDKAQINLDSIVKSLETQQISLMKDISMLDQMCDLNKDYYKEISMYILAGKKKIDQLRSIDLPRLTQNAKQTGSQELIQEANDLEKQVGRFEKKRYDLELTRSEEHTSELQSRQYLVCRLLLEKKNGGIDVLHALFLSISLKSEEDS